MPPDADALLLAGPGVRAGLETLARALGTTAVVMFLYVVLPFDRDIDKSIVAFLLAGVAVLVVVIAMQVRAILRAAHPGLRAIEALGVSIPLFLVLFSITYLLLSRGDAAAFTQPLSRLDAFYFTTTVFSTVGFGDIAARTGMARGVVTLQMIADLIVIGLGLRVITGAVKVSRERRSATGGIDGSPDPT